MPNSSAPSVESILSTVIEAIIVTDEAGVIQFVNLSVENIFGYAPWELMGKNISLLMPDPHNVQHDVYIQNYLETGQAKGIGARREVIAKRKDGTTFPAYLSVSEGGKAEKNRFFTGVIHDITEIKQYQDSLKKEGAFTAAVLNTVRSLVIVLDRRGCIVNFNRACEDTTGYSFEEVAGKPFWDFFLTAEDRESVIKNFLSSDARKLVNNFEAVWLTKNGERRLIAWSNLLILDEKNSPEYLIGTGLDITDRRQLEHMVLEVTKNEQRRLGQELHDGIAQHLAATAIAAKVLEKKLTRESPSVANELKRVVDMVNQAVVQTRKLAQGLYALDMQSEDLASSLKRLAHDTEKTIHVRCLVMAEAGVRVVDEASATHLYRIAREAVMNAVKHGKCKNIRIYLERKNGREAVLRIENDGNRFLKRSHRKGLGLRIMHSRAAMLNASLEIAPGPRAGAVVTCVFPFSL